MVRYRRNRVPGGTYFFTVAIEDRRSTLLTTRIADLRGAFRKARAERPFDIDAIVILPEHLHAILASPEGDADFPLRWRRIKTVFAQALLADGVVVAAATEAGTFYGSAGFGSIRSATKPTIAGTWITFITTQSSMATSRTLWTGRIRRCIGLCAKGYCSPIGAELPKRMAGLGSR